MSLASGLAAAAGRSCTVLEPLGGRQDLNGHNDDPRHQGQGSDRVGGPPWPYLPGIPVGLADGLYPSERPGDSLSSPWACSSPPTMSNFNRR